MTTWQIFSDADNGFRWEISDQSIVNEPVAAPSNSPSLPSMADLLLQGCSKLTENHWCDLESPPTIQSELGKLVAVKQSSTVKALSIHGDKRDTFADSGCFNQIENHQNNLQNPAMFQSGLGKSVTVRPSSVMKAESILGDGCNTFADRGCANQIEKHHGSFQSPPMFQSGSGELMRVKQSSITNALSIFGAEGDDTFNGTGCANQIEKQHDSFQSPPMFQSGLGKLMTVKQSSITKALSIFGAEGEDTFNGTGCTNHIEKHDGNFQSPPTFQSGSGKLMTVKQSSITKALSIFGAEGDDTFNGHLSNQSHMRCISPNSMFQTGSGKKVNLSSAGLVRAKALLGLQENHDHNNLLGIEQSIDQSNEMFGWPNSSYLETKEGADSTRYEDVTMPPLSALNFKNTSFQSGVKSEPIPNLVNSSKCPQIKFQSAGGRSISVSKDALQRAKSLLGHLEDGFDEENASYPAFSFIKKQRVSEDYSNNEKSHFSGLTHRETEKSNHMAKVFVSPLRSASNQYQPSIVTEKITLRNNLINKFDAEDHNNIHKFPNTHSQQRLPCSRPSNNFLEDEVKSRTIQEGSSLRRPLGDISNTLGMMHNNDKLNVNLKRRFGRSSVSPFKKPRNSRFITPLKDGVLAPNGNSTLTTEESCSRRRIFAQYPFQGSRKYVEEYFGMPPLHEKTVKKLPDYIRRMSPEKAEKHLFPDASGVGCIGAEAFYDMLIQSGASIEYTSKKWVANHYKWIVWKLACYERCYPCKASGNLLTVNNVIEELKLRYEREVNYGHRSAIKRVLEGDQPPSSVLVLCISSICSKHVASPPTPTISSNVENGTATKVELTDGWYSINAFLDVHLSRKLAAGKIFVGQKLRIWGAGLCGWAGPVSPLEESSTVAFTLHINGTYRAHWADHLGLSKAGGVPLAFRCIKGMGGPVPCTLVGVTRIYPVQYREKLRNGGSIVRSDRMEAKMVQLYNQRCSTVVEGIMSEFERETKDPSYRNDNDSEEGAKILKILETAAEPELLMAGMSLEQLSSFASYRAKLKETRESDMHKSIETALEAAGLSGRDVTPFMRVRVVGLTPTNSTKNCNTRKGIITIWNPCDKQLSELVEGKAYVVTGLMPSNLEANTLHLQARGSTTRWVTLSTSSTEHFQPFFSPRRSLLLSHLGEIPLSSEFDIAALVIYVGEVYMDVHQKKQWLFVADGSMSESHLEEPSHALLAISFSLPYISCESVAPVSHNLVGSVVCFCNLIKRAKDQVNHIWVAEATEDSTYSLSYNGCTSHLRDAAASAERWAKISSSTIEKLRQKVLYVIDNKEG